MGITVGSVILGIIAVLCFVFSYMQFKEKGVLFNNAYLYASKQEREAMDKTPHYRQSGVVFLLLGLIFLINAIEATLHTGRLFYCVIALAAAAVIYAVISSVRIAGKK